jgi:hypothetical protein
MPKRVNKLLNKRSKEDRYVKITHLLAVKKPRRGLGGSKSKIGSSENNQAASGKKGLSIYDINNFIVQSNPAKIGKVESVAHVIVPRFKELGKRFYEEKICLLDVCVLFILE